MLSAIDISPETIAELCEKWHIRKLAVFGSALRDDFSEDSDVDILVEFEPEHTPGFFALFDLEQALSQMMASRPIDIVTYAAINKHLRPSILDSAKTLFPL